MFRKILLILLLYGLIALSMVLEYHASAEGSVCEHPRTICVPVKLPDCVIPDCEVLRPLLRRSCVQAWHEHFMKTRVRSPQRFPSFVFRDDPLDAVARVSTLNIMRAIGQ